MGKFIKNDYAYAENQGVKIPSEVLSSVSLLFYSYSLIYGSDYLFYFLPSCTV